MHQSQHVQKFRYSFALYILLFCVSACTRMCTKAHEDMNPDEVVETYLDFVFSIKNISQKEALMEYTSGELQAAIAGATDETFTEAYINRKYELKKFAIMERRDRTPRETEITFQLEYLDYPREGEPSKEPAHVVTENTVLVIKEKNRWLINAVIGNQTTFDFPLSELSNIQGSGGESPH